MIIGIGTDIVDIDRIERLLQRHPKRFAHKILSTNELKAFERCTKPHRFLAKRFAVKEAFVKAVGLGLRHGMQWKDIATLHDEWGKPILQLNGRAREIADELGINAYHVSIADEQHTAIAYLILEKQG